MEDIAQNRVPADFPEFKETVEAWGKHMLDGCNTVAEMAAVGLGLERSTFSEMMKSSINTKWELSSQDSIMTLTFSQSMESQDILAFLLGSELEKSSQ